MNEIQVVKVGGSLLDLTDLPRRLRRWLDEPGKAASRGSEKTNVLVAGGGAAVNRIRRWDARYGLGEQRCHQLALGVMSANSVCLGRWTDIVVRHCLETIKSTAEECVCDPAPAIRAMDHIPSSWEVTGDSIAALIAQRLGASDLVLMKSIDVPPDYGLEQWVAAGIVDPYFPIASRCIGRIKFVNLRR